MNFQPSVILTHRAALLMIGAAVDKAEELGQPQCIVIVDASGGVLVELKMTGAKFISLKSAKTKALTAASICAPSSNIPDHVRPAIAAATGGHITGLAGGLPILTDGKCVGAIGIGSGSPEQDVEVAIAALEAIGVVTNFD